MKSSNHCIAAVSAAKEKGGLRPRPGKIFGCDKESFAGHWTKRRQGAKPHERIDEVMPPKKPVSKIPTSNQKPTLLVLIIKEYLKLNHNTFCLIVN